MSFKHKNVLPETGFTSIYTSMVDSNVQLTHNQWKMRSHSSDRDTDEEDEIFYLNFEDCKSADDKEGFLLMCSENELVQLINHLRMIRGV